MKMHPAYQVFMLQLITVTELQLWSHNENNFMDGVTTTWGAVLEGRSIRKVENHRLQGSSISLLGWGSNQLACHWEPPVNTAEERGRAVGEGRQGQAHANQTRTCSDSSHRLLRPSLWMGKLRLWWQGLGLLPSSPSSACCCRMWAQGCSGTIT